MVHHAWTHRIAHVRTTHVRAHLHGHTRVLTHLVHSLPRETHHRVAHGICHLRPALTTRPALRERVLERRTTLLHRLLWLLWLLLLLRLLLLLLLLRTGCSARPFSVRR